MLKAGRIVVSEWTHNNVITIALNPYIPTLVIRDVPLGIAIEADMIDAGVEKLLEEVWVIVEEECHKSVMARHSWGIVIDGG